MVRVVTVLLLLCAVSAAVATTPPYENSMQQITASNSAPDLNALRQQGSAAFQKGDFAGALHAFQQVIAVDPKDVVAYNISGNCSMKLKDYPAAITSFRHALELMPDEYHNLSGLIRSYTLAGMAPERDELRKHIEELSKSGKLPDNFVYVFETFNVGEQKIEVAEFPKIQGFYGERYRFMSFNNAGQETLCVTLESDSMDQPSWAKEHPKEAAEGKRHFSLDGYARDAHYTFDFFDGEPAYDKIKEEATQVLSGKKKAMSKTQYPSPQRIPGEQ